MEDEAGYPLQGKKFKHKVPLRPNVNHTLLCSNSSSESERSIILGPRAQDGESTGEHLAL